jgi:hypothetical protein
MYYFKPLLSYVVDVYVVHFEPFWVNTIGIIADLT